MILSWSKSCHCNPASPGPTDVSDSIAAVYGLNGYRVKTWTAANSVHWLRSLLLNDLP